MTNFLVIALFLIPGKYSVEIPYLSHPPKIDGNLESAWKDALELSKLLDARTGKTAPVKTRILLGYSSDALYIAFVCYDDMSKVRVHSSKRDACFGDDMVGLYIDSYKNREMAYQFQCNPLGCQIDGKTGQEIWEQHSDFEWESKGKMYSDHWVVEMKIPFSTLTFPAGENQVWRIQFFRVRPRKSLEFYTWFPLDNDFSHMLDHMGEIRFLLRKGHFISTIIYPYFLISRTYLADSTYWEDRFGITADLGLSNNSHFLITIVPDHREIETDYPVISVNRRTAVGYPEKRPFFQRADEIFKFPLYAFYSRSINDPYFAAKFFSKGRKLDVGFISAYNRNSTWIVPVGEYSSLVGSDLNSLINIFTLGWKFSKGSYIGSFVSHRMTMSKSGNGNQMTGGVRWDLRFFRGLEAYGAFLGSYTEEVVDSSLYFYSGLPDSFDNKYSTIFDGEKYSGIAYQGGLTISTPHFYADIYTRHISPTFRDQNGYIAVNNHRSYNLNSYLPFYPQNSGIQEMKLGLEASLDRTFDNKFIGNSVSPYVSLILPFQTQLKLSYEWEKEFYRVKNFAKNQFLASMETSPHSWISFNGQLNFGDEIYYYGNPPDLEDFKSAAAGITLTPLKSFLVNISYHREILSGVYDLYTLWLKTQVSYRSFYFRWIGFYNDQQEMYYFFPLISIEHRHFVRIYLGGAFMKPASSKKLLYYQLYLKTSFTMGR